MVAATAGGLLAAATPAAGQTGDTPQTVRPGRGGTDPGPRNLTLDRQNADILVHHRRTTAPSNLRFSFSDAHMRLESGGWTPR